MKQKGILLVLFILLSIISLTLCRDDKLVDLVTHTYQFVSVVDTFPTANGLDVTKNTPISIKFSQPMNSDTFTQAFSLSNNTSSVLITNYTVEWSTDKTTVTLTQPINFLTGDTIYNFKIGSAIRSATGNPIASDYFSTFVTGNLADTTPPTLTNITVKATSGDKAGSSNISGATIPPTISGVELKFDDTMVKSSVEKSFTLSAGGTTATPSGIVWSTSTTTNDTVLFQFNNLPQNTNCEINLTTGALDKGGNGVSNPIKALSFYSGSFSGADPNETNDTSGSATLLTVGTPKYANIYPSGDVDWYKINLTSGTNYNIKLQNLAFDYDIEVYFPATTFQVGSTNAGTTSELINYTAPTSGTYYIKVFAKNGTDNSTSAYNILVESVTGDAYEPGDNTPSGATTLSVNSTVTNHTLHVLNDVDYFKFNASASTAYTITLNNVPSTANYDIELLDSTLAQVALSNNPGLGASETINYTAGSSGIYYIRVYSSSGSSTTPYSLSLTSAPGVDYTFISDTTPASPTTGSPIGIVNFTIQNGGGTAGSKDILCEIYLSSDQTIGLGDTLVGSRTISGGLGTGATATCSTTSGNWPSTAGTYYLLARVTASDDTVPGNNIRIGTANVGGYVDYQTAILTITSGSGPYNELSTITGVFTVQNIGTTNGGSGRNWAVYVSANGTTPLIGTPIASGTTNTLSAGQSQVIPFTGSWPSGSAGTGRYLIAKFTSGSDTNTSNDITNTGTFTINAAYFDYQAGSVTLSIPTPYYEQDNTISGVFSIQNIGTLQGSNRNWDIYISNDGVNASSASVASGTTGLITAGSTQLYSFSGTWPTGSNGNPRYIIAKLSGVADSNSTNDTGSTTSFIISVIPAPTGVTASDGTYGDYVKISWNIVAGATGYYVFRNGVQIANVTTTYYDDYGAQMARINYTYKVQAYRSGGATSVDSLTDTGYRDGNSIFYENFEAPLQTVGSFPTGWNIVGTGTFTYRQVESGGANGTSQSFRQVGWGGPNDGVLRTMGSGITPTYISYYIKCNSGTSWAGDMMFWYSGEPDNMDDIAFYNGQYINYYTSHVILSSFTYGTWYHIELKNINWTTKSFDVYVNGALKLSSEPFAHSSLTSIRELRLGSWAGDASSDVSLDEIDVRN